VSEVPTPVRPGADDDANVVLGVLTRTGAKGVSVSLALAHRTIELICIVAGATGAAALLLGLWAWHRSLSGAVVAVVGGGTTIVVAGYVLVRARALAQAIRHPAETLAQAQDLVLRAKGSPALHQLAARVRARRSARAAGLGRMRRALATGRLISGVIGLASPDPERHAHLVPFTPDRLKNLWLAIVLGLWAWLVSAVIASLALLTLAIQAL
jgi:hypothetical protein